MFDLYPKEDWNFVFGQAVASKGTGIFSFARYRGCGTGPLFTRRCLMVLCHEIGHLFGIAHCVWWQCCMNGSNGDWESDRRPFPLCPTDLAKLREAIGPEFRLLEREERLAEVLEAAGLDDMGRWHRLHGEVLQECGAKRAALPAVGNKVNADCKEVPSVPGTGQGRPRRLPGESSRRSSSSSSRPQ